MNTLNFRDMPEINRLINNLASYVPKEVNVNMIINVGLRIPKFRNHMGILVGVRQHKFKAFYVFTIR